jgi:hypothetical protein
VACEPDTCRPAGKVQQQEPDKLRRLRGGSRRTWGRELRVEGSHLLTRCDGRQQGLEFVIGGPPVLRVQGARLSSKALVLRLGLRQTRRRRADRRRLRRRSKPFQSEECLRFHALSSMPGQRAFVSARPRPRHAAASRRCRRRDSNPRHADYDSGPIWLNHRGFRAGWTRRWTQPRVRPHAIPRVSHAPAPALPRPPRHVAGARLRAGRVR